MKNKISYVLKYFAFGALWALPVIVSAQNEVDRGLFNIRILFPFGGLGSSNDLPGLIFNIIRLLLVIAGILAVLFIIVGGYQYITSAGNEEQAEKGKNTLINAVIGVVVIVLSYVIINVIVGTISRF